MSNNTNRIVVLSMVSPITPGHLLTAARVLDETVVLKETCFGLLIEGENEIVERVVLKLKELSPYTVFSKQRGFAIGDRCKCRRGENGRISGAQRIGFHQLEREREMLPLIGEAMEFIDSSDEMEEIKMKNEKPTYEDIRFLIGQILADEYMEISQ